jgi:hypothetical protein
MTRPDHGDAASAAGWPVADGVATPPDAARQPDPSVGRVSVHAGPPSPPSLPGPPKFVPPPWHGAPQGRPALPSRPAPPVHPGYQVTVPPPDPDRGQAPDRGHAPDDGQRKGGRKRRKGKRGAAAAGSPRAGVPAASDNLDARLAATAGATGVAGQDFYIEDGTVQPATEKRRKKRSRMAGGRWRRQALLAAMVLALAILVINGVYRLAGKALYDPPEPPPGAGFPTAAASAYAVRFTHAYLNWDEDAAQNRAQELRLFFPSPTDSQLGWDGKGVQRVIGVPVGAGVTARDDRHAVVHVAAYLDPGGWTCMDVGVYATDGATGFAITSYAAFVACPPVAAVAVPLDTREADGQFAVAVRPTLETFFKAYGGSAPELAQVITEDSGIFGLRGVATYIDMPSLIVPVLEKGADESVRTADVRVRWRMLSGGAITQAYRLTLRQIGGRWFVQRVEGGIETGDVAPAQGGPGPQPSVRPSTEPSAGASGSAPPSSNPAVRPSG